MKDSASIMSRRSGFRQIFDAESVTAHSLSDGCALCPWALVVQVPPVATCSVREGRVPSSLSKAAGVYGNGVGFRV